MGSFGSVIRFGIIDIQACPSEELMLSLGFDRHLATKYGINNVNWVDVLMMRISILVVVILFTIAPVTVVRSLYSIILDDLLCVDILEDTTILHCVTGPRWS